MSQSIPRFAVPLYASQIQADTPHASANEIEIAQQTNCLASWVSPNTMAWCFPDPAAAPACSVTTAGTFVDFTIASASGTVTWGIPWLLYPGCDNVQVTMVLATKQEASIVGRLQNRTLISSISTQTGDPMLSRLMPTMAQPWRREFNFYKSHIAVCGFASTRLTVHSSRKTFIVPQVTTTAADSLMIAEGEGHSVKIQSIAITDMPPRQATG